MLTIYKLFRKFLRMAIVSGLAALTFGMCGTATGQELVRIPTTALNNGKAFVEGVLTLPTASPNDRSLPAVILLHAGGGWEVPVTNQYAKALNVAGFAALELRLFKNESERAPNRIGYLQNLYDALRFIASRPEINPDRVSVAGFSHGGIVTLTAATTWALERFGGGSGLKFAAHAPFYPVCYAYTAFAKAARQVGEIPGDALVKWTGAPVRIFAGGKDDYDDRDPKACEEFVSYVPEPQRNNFSVMLYPDATHGWDQPSARFYEKVACKNRGCTNSNVASATVTARSIADLVEFMSTRGR